MPVKHHGKTHELTEQAKRKASFHIEKNKWVRRIFPAIAWHDDKQHFAGVNDAEAVRFPFTTVNRK